MKIILLFISDKELTSNEKVSETYERWEAVVGMDKCYQVWNADISDL